MALADFAGGVQDALAALVKQRLEQDELARRAQMEQARLGLQERQLSQQGEQFTQRLNLDRDELGVRQEQFAAEAPEREARTGFIRTQTRDLEQKPLYAEQTRQAQEARDRAQGEQRMREISAQGANALRAAQAGQRPRVQQVRGVDTQNRPVVRLVNVDTQQVLAEYPAGMSAEELLLKIQQEAAAREKGKAEGKASAGTGALLSALQGLFGWADDEESPFEIVEIK